MPLVVPERGGALGVRRPRIERRELHWGIAWGVGWGSKPGGSGKVPFLTNTYVGLAGVDLRLGVIG